MQMVIDIGLGMLHGNRPLIIKAGREEDTAVRQEKPVGIGHVHIDLPPGAIVTRTLIAEHSAALSANLSYMHGQVKLFNNTDISLAQLPGKTAGMGMCLRCENLGQSYQTGTHRHRIAVEG